MIEQIDMVVSHVATAAEGIRVFDLRRRDGADLLPFEAGAHIDVHLPGGLTRPYSLLNDEIERDRYQIAVQHELRGRGGSRAMHDLVVGETLRIGPPRSAFKLDRTVSHILLIAGGIGITPLLGMARVLHREGRSFALHYAAKSPLRMAFRTEILAHDFAVPPLLYHGGGADGARLCAASTIAAAPEGTHVYLCGPDRLAADVVAALARRPDMILHTERFAAAVATRPAEGEGTFVVRLVRSGLEMTVEPGQTILDRLRAEGVGVDTSCESGVCGTCITRVVSGEPHHDDYVLTPEQRAAGDCMIVCVSRAKPGDTLVLDL